MVDLDFTYKFIGERLCLDFCNTGEDREGDYVGELLGSYDRLLNWSKQATLLNDQEARRLQQLGVENQSEATRVYNTALALREALYHLFSAAATERNPEPPDLAVLNEILSEALAHRRIQFTGSHFDWVWDHSDNDLAQMLWPIAFSASELLVSPELDRVQECRNGNCSWLFLDLSRNHSRRWCTMEGCGNRVKARRFRKREA